MLELILTETSENPTKATLGQITYNLNDDYNNQYRMPYTNIKSIKIMEDIMLLKILKKLLIMM